ncbi:MAG: hypothetical protein E3J86_13580, partial [Candidatus Thorarchaeota archaeon]
MEEIYIGSMGPFLYDPTEDLPGQAGVKQGLATSGAPIRNEDVLRLADIGSIAAPHDASYVVIGLNANLAAERRLQVGNSLSLTDGGANGDVTLDAIQDIRTTAVPEFAGLGIGTAAPQTNLDVVDAGTNTQSQIFIRGFNDQVVYCPELRIKKSHSDTLGTLVTTIDTEKLGQIIFSGVDSGNLVDDGAHITAIQDGAAGAFIPTNLILLTHSSTAKNINQFVLHNDGNVGIGTAAPGAKLEVVGSCEFGDEGTNYTAIEADGDVLFVGGGGLHFGEVSVVGNANASVLNSAAKVQFVHFDT